MTHRMLTAGLAALALVACDTGDSASRSQAAPPALSGSYTPDSIRGEQLAQFRAGLDSVAELAGGAPSRDSLVGLFARAALAGDTATLNQLRLTRAEWGWLYYPTSPQARPPYDLDPASMWLTTSLQGERGAARLLAALAGKPYRYAGYECPGEPSREGENTAYGPCMVKLLQAPGDTSEGRLFGLILERHGQWKFVSYANRMD